MKEEIRECVQFCIERLTEALADLERIDSIPLKEDLIGDTYTLARVQSIAFKARVNLDFVKAELESCLPGRPK